MHGTAGQSEVPLENSASLLYLTPNFLPVLLYSSVKLLQPTASYMLWSGSVHVGLHGITAAIMQHKGMFLDMKY